MLPWFDGHLDLTYLALHGRDLARPAESCGGSLQPASVTFPSLRKARVWAAVSTVFVRRQTAGVHGDFCFSTPQEAQQRGLNQLELHRRWIAGNLIRPLAPASPPPADDAPPDRLEVALALEGAACLRWVEDLDVFHAAGVRIVSLAWAEGSQWSGGDQSGGDVTAAGLRLIRRLDELSIIHDVSHLSERAFWTLLEQARGPVIASHSNCLALLPGAVHPQRHLSDRQILALHARGGVIGINLFARFILPPDELARRRANIGDLLAHIRHIEQLTGTRDMLALGSDMDSGFSLDLLPCDLQGPADLPRLAEALSAEGWSDDQVRRFANRWCELLAG